MKLMNRISALGLALGLCLGPLQIGPANAADPIQSIYGRSVGMDAAQDATRTFRCAPPVRPMLDMSGMFAFYKSDKTQSVIDKAKMQAYVKKTWPSIQVQKTLSESVAATFTSPPNAVAARNCIVRQADLWAGSSAMLQGLKDNDPLGHRQAVLTIIWTSITFANALQVSDHVSPLSPEQKMSLRKWFATMSKEIELNFAIMPRAPKDEWLNGNSNQRFWAGAAVGLMAVETGDRPAFQWAMEILRGALKDIDEDGSMPSEMWRGTKALHYQNFALQAVSILVALADANDVQLSDDENKRLNRAARFALRTYQHPETFQKTSARPQERGAQLMSWTAPMAVHFQVSDKNLSGELAQEFLSLGNDTLNNCQSTCNLYYERLLTSKKRQ